MKCKLCPRRCQADRDYTVGYCGGGAYIKVARAALHFWEEPCISGTNGSGTIFFSGCPLKCVYCQNHEISVGNYGAEITPERLGDIMFELRDKGAHNINLVSPTQYVPWIIRSLDRVKHRLNIPIVYNTGGYENPDTIRTLNGYIDIYLPDIKYYSREYSLKYSGAADYFDTAVTAIREMLTQTGKFKFDGDMLKSGVMIRHMILPGLRRDSIEIMKQIKQNFGGDVLLSLMRQYTPNGKTDVTLNRKLTTFEYNSVLDTVVSLGLEGYTQDHEAADGIYIPDFNLEGVTGNGDLL
jgi:Uncharacterized Fe-S protein PflX, homolog of pyruvate formate lyase activating proteins